MTEGSNYLTTYYAKRIIGDTAAANAAKALLQTGTGITTNTWILHRDNRNDLYGIKYLYDSSTNGTADKIETYGGATDINSNDIPTAWIRLDTGDIYLLGRLGIGYDPTDNNTNKLYVNGTSYFTDSLTINNGSVNGEVIRIVGANNAVFSFKLSGGTAASNVDIGWNWTNVEGAGAAFRSTSFPSQAGEFRIYARKKNSSDAAVYTQLIGTAGETTNGGALTWADRRVVTSTDGTAVGSTTQPVYVDSDGIVQTLSYSLNATINSGTANYVAYYSGANAISDAKSATTMIMPAHYYHNLYNNNPTTGTTVYVHYYNSGTTSTNTFANLRVKSGNSYKVLAFGGDGELTWGGTITANGGYLKSTLNSNTVTIGSRNSSYCHIESSVNIPFYFNRTTLIDGDLGNTSYPVKNIYIGKSDGAGIYYQGTKASYRMIRFIDNTGDNYGNGISIGGGGYTVLGSGESADTMVGNLGYTGGSEVTVIASDGEIQFYPGQNSYDASAKLTMTASRFWAGVNGNTTREAQVGCQSGAGQIYFWSAASTSGARGIYIPAHGTGSARGIIEVNTNNYTYIRGNETWGNQVLVNSNWIGFYKDAFNTGTRYGYIQCNVDRMYFRKENSTANLTYYFDFGSNVHSATQFDAPKMETNWLRVVNNSSNNTDDAMVYLEDKNSSDWGLKVNCDGYNYGINVVTSANAANAIQTNGRITGSAFYASANVMPSIRCTRTDAAETSIYLENSTAGWAMGVHSWGVGAGCFAIGQYAGTGSSKWRIKIDNSGYVYTSSYLNLGAGNEKNNSSPSYVAGFNSSDNFVRSYSTAYLNVNSATYASSYLANRGSVSGSTHAAALKAWFDSNKSTEPRNCLVAHYSSAYSNGSMCFGYFLSGYDSGPYGGFFVAHYNTPYYVGIQSGTYTESKIWKKGDSVTSAVWNDYAEYRTSSCTEPGYCVFENGDDTLSKTTQRLQHFAGIISDTWGFSQGETETAKTPIAVSGRVLAYTYKDRNEYKPGDCVCAAPNGTIDIMTRDEIMLYPDKIVGTVSCIPTYEEWGGGENADRPPIKVNGRIWIKVK